MPKLILFLVATFLVVSCGNKMSENFHMDKPIWDISDYDAAIHEIKFKMPKEEGLPRLSDPELAPVFLKLVDKENVNIVLADPQLGLEYRLEVGENFFAIAKDIEELYSEKNVQDQFVYPTEFVKAIDFSLNIQVQLFKIGNDNIIKGSLDSLDSSVRSVVNRNIESIISNFVMYFDYLLKEDSFTEESLNEFATVINTQFPRLLNTFPDGDFGALKQISIQLKEKIKNENVKNALSTLITTIEEKEQAKINEAALIEESAKK